MMEAENRLTHGQLQLSFRYHRGKTQMSDKYQQPPLRASHTLYVDDDSSKATVYLVETSGGLVSGDLNSYHITLEKNAQVNLIPQSATKVYPALEDQHSRQEITIELAEEACLRWFPETTIPFQDANFRSKIKINLTESSTLLFGEILSPGREKSGEVFQFKRWQSLFEVWLQGKECLVYDALILEPDRLEHSQIGLLEKYKYVGYLWFISPVAVRLDESVVQDQLKQSENMKASVTRIDKHGLHLRWMSTNLLEMKKSMHEAWQMLSDAI